MKKLFMLIKVSMTEDMNLFKISTKKNNTFTKIFLPIILALIIMISLGSYSSMLIEGLEKIKMEFVLLTIFILFTSIITIIEGIYKSGNLLFNAKDDDLLLSLPISKKMVLFIRIFKFYVFELLYNSLFLLPAIIIYAIYTTPGIIFYFVSIIGLLLFPIIPIIISIIIGVITSFLSSKFKGKNYVQTIITIIFLLGVMYFSYNSNNLIASLSDNAVSINDLITSMYYPAGAYISLINNFNILKLLEFILINIVLFIITILLIGKVFFNINSNVKKVKISKRKKSFKIKSSSVIMSLVKKEFNRFINSTVFVTNAGFGLVLFIIGCIFLTIKFDSIANGLIKTDPAITMDYLKEFIPIILFAFVCFSSFMTSITSSMISLEGQSFNLLKSLPIKAFTIIKSKVLSALFIMIPCILIGDIIVFITFKFDIISIILIVIASILFPLISETIGIIVNLKYPRMDAKNDTEVVKQSMSSMISVFIGMGLLGITIFLLIKIVLTGFSIYYTMLIFIIVYLIIYLCLYILLSKVCDKWFNNIEA